MTNDLHKDESQSSVQPGSVYSQPIPTDVPPPEPPQIPLEPADVPIDTPQPEITPTPEQN